MTSARTKVFQAATMGRGSEVASTVSSMSLTIPNRWVVPATSTGVSTGSAPGEVRVTECQPGPNP